MAFLFDDDDKLATRCFSAHRRAAAQHSREFQSQIRRAALPELRAMTENIGIDLAQTEIASPAFFAAEEKLDRLHSRFRTETSHAISGSADALCKLHRVAKHSHLLLEDYLRYGWTQEELTKHTRTAFRIQSTSAELLSTLSSELARTYISIRMACDIDHPLPRHLMRLVDNLNEPLPGLRDLVFGRATTPEIVG